MEDNIVILVDEFGSLTIYIDNDSELSQAQIDIASSIILLEEPSLVLKITLFLEKKFSQALFFISEWWRGYEE
jgi:hypothetical protein